MAINHGNAAFYAVCRYAMLAATVLEYKWTVVTSLAHRVVIFHVKVVGTLQW